MDDDSQLQDDEILALTSIFGDECVREVMRDAQSAASSGSPATPRELKIGIPSLQAVPRIELHATLPSDYPSASPPVFELRSELLDGAAVADIAGALQDLYIPGDVVLYAWVDHLQQEWETRAPPPPPPSPPSPPPEQAPTPAPPPVSEADILLEQIAARIFHGEPITERKSTFQAHVCAITDVAEVDLVIESLLQNNKIRAATHNIMAYRIEMDREGTFAQDADDDGEDAAGGRLLHLLQMVDARNVAVVVSRWFGGIHLGPARFGLINKAARDALEAQGFIRKKTTSSK